jgi:flagellar hook-basal body complex protein FliE
MNINANRAASAYSNQLKLMESMETATMPDSKEDKTSFADMIGEALSSAIDTQYKTEQVKLDSLTGKASITDLVTAVSEAELTLNTVVNIRDRMISAYQDILRMPI